MSDAVDKREIAPELALLREEIDGTPDRGVLDGDPEKLRRYLGFLQNRQVARNIAVSHK